MRVTKKLMAGAATLLVAAGCGDELAKQNFPRTAVPLEQVATGDVPAEPIDDEDLTLAKMRKADVCSLAEGATADAGSAEDSWVSLGDSCSITLTDAGGKQIDVRMTLGDALWVEYDNATGGVEGLPLIEEAIDESCNASAITATDPERGDYGLTVNATYSGDACDMAVRVLGKAITIMREDPPLADIAEGSLRTADACEVLPEDVRADLGLESGSEPSGLYGCIFGDFVGVEASVDFWLESSVIPEKNSEEIELDAGITAQVDPSSTDDAECKLSWEHRSLDDDFAEVVVLRYSDLVDEDATTEDACERIVTLADAVAGELPKE